MEIFGLLNEVEFDCFQYMGNKKILNSKDSLLIFTLASEVVE
jgi:hypothetical protein